MERILAESDGSESDFESSDSEDDSVDNNRVYGFPNDRGGNAFAIVREQESFENDEADAEGSDFSEEHEIIDAEEAPEIAFVDERNSDILVARHNVVMAANGAAAGLLVIRGTTERETAERDFFSVFFFFFFFLTKQQQQTNSNISHKIKGMHIFFILRGRSRAKLSSLFRVRISRSVTTLRTCLDHPFFFFFRLLSNAFSDFGSVGRKRKKKETKKKLEKESGTGRPGISA